MKKINLLLVFVLTIFSCASEPNTGYRNNVTHNNNITNREKIFNEETGGFSLVIPRSWQEVDLPVFRYKSIAGPIERGFTPLINFSIDTHNDTLKEMLDRLLISWSNTHGNNFNLLQRSDFITQNDLTGEKIIINISMYGEQMRQVIYCLPGRRQNTSILIAGGTQIEAGDIFDEIFDRIAKTFQWTDHILLLEEGRFIEESMGFSILLPETWEVDDEMDPPNKIIIGLEENGHVLIRFLMGNSNNYPLSFLVNYMIDSFKNTYELFELVQRNNFITSSNIRGERLLINVLINNMVHRQVFYFIPGSNNRVFTAFCVTSAEPDNAFDETLNRVMETFEWIE